MITIGKILYVMTDGIYLSIDHGSVVVKKDDKVVSRIPLISVSQIIIIANTVISQYLISACSEYGVRLSYVSPYGKYLGTFGGKEIGNVTLRMKQYQAYENDTKIAIAKNIVLGKTINQMSVLAKYESKNKTIKQIRGKLADGIKRLLDCDNVDSIRGIEGECAAKYYQAFDMILSGVPEEMRFVERSKRPPRNRLNALLSLLYTIETTSCIAAISAYGLDPYLGYLHEIHPGRESLACDLVEEFRAPVIDAYVLKAVNLRKIKTIHFEEKNGIFSLTADGKKQVLGGWEKYKEEKIYFKLYEKDVPIKILPFLQAQLMGQFLRGDIQEYPPFTDWR